MATNRVTQIVGQTLYGDSSTDTQMFLTQIVGQILYAAVAPPDPPTGFRPGGFGVQIID